MQDNLERLRYVPVHLPRGQSFSVAPWRSRRGPGLAPPMQYRWQVAVRGLGLWRKGWLSPVSSSNRRPYWSGKSPHPQAIARVVNFARGATMSWPSVNVPVGQAGSRHLQTRADHSNWTGTPKHGASATRHRHRPCPTATTPHDGHPPTSASLSSTPARAAATSTVVHVGAFERTACLVASDPEGPDPYLIAPPRRARPSTPARAQL